MSEAATSARARLQAELIQHLMDEGQASLLALTQLTSYSLPTVRNGLLYLREVGLCVRTKSRDAAGHSLPLYALTRAGIEVALLAESVAV